MPLYCETGQFEAVCAGKAKMERIDSDLLTLAQELAPLVAGITEEGEITLKVQHGWVASIGMFVRQFRRKRKA